MSVDKYASIDFGPSSPIAKNLFARLESELENEVIYLTPVFSRDGLPPFLTMEMSSWYQSCVKPLRGPALQAAIAIFQARNLPKGGHGLLLEHERDKIEQTKLQEIATERETFQQIKEVANVVSELADLREQYESLKAQNGRDALRWRPFSYWIIMFCFMLPEFLINWDSFLKIPGFTMAYASGLMLIVAIAFAFSAHSIGRIVKQWKELFGGYVGNTDKSKSRREFGVGLALFLLGVAAIGWGRWYFIQAALMEKSILQGGGLELSDYLQFAGAMLGNIIIYLLGVLWSFTRHDSVPGFSELRAALEKLEGRKLELFEKNLTRRNQQHIQRSQKDLERVARVEANQKQQLDGYQQARQLFGILKHADDLVLALLSEYRSRLVGQLKGRRGSVRFRVEDIRLADLDTQIMLTLDQYAATPLELRYV
jgi:hypothetical protein